MASLLRPQLIISRKYTDCEFSLNQRTFLTSRAVSKSLELDTSFPLDSDLTRILCGAPATKFHACYPPENPLCCYTHCYSNTVTHLNTVSTPGTSADTKSGSGLLLRRQWAPCVSGVLGGRASQYSLPPIIRQHLKGAHTSQSPYGQVGQPCC